MPPWFALTVHVPAPTNVTVEPETVHTPALLGAAVKRDRKARGRRGRDRVRGAAVTAAPGALDVKLIVCVAGGGVTTANDCCTCGAGR